MQQLSYCTPPNLGWLIAKLDEEEMTILNEAISQGGNDHKGHLAGQLSESFTLTDDGGRFFQQVLIPLIQTYADVFQDLGVQVPLSCPSRYYLSNFWCNIQQQVEFNPTHDHTGVYSFAVWMKNPVSYSDQVKLAAAKGSNRPAVSTFQFHYQDILGRTEDTIYPQSPEVEGTILFFPSRLRHSVFPFYECEDARISISGNIGLEPVHEVAQGP